MFYSIVLIPLSSLPRWMRYNFGIIVFFTILIVDVFFSLVPDKIAEPFCFSSVFPSAANSIENGNPSGHCAAYSVSILYLFLYAI